jgi:hypothetical protein
MIGFTNINMISISKVNIVKAFNFLNYAGKKSVEGVALFAGFGEATVFHVKEVIIPKQSTYNIEQGLMYAVDGEELHKINVWLYKNNMNLIAQIHSHPSEAYHSTTDDRFPIVDTFGGVSIVVPDFARGLVSLNNCAIYRLSLKKTWDKLTTEEVNTLFQII